MPIILSKSNKPGKRYKVNVDGKTIHFGSSNHENYTMHKDEERKKRYIARHRKRENWGKSGVKTAGFWSRWLLWNKKTIKSSLTDIRSKFRLWIINKI